MCLSKDTTKIVKKQITMHITDNELISRKNKILLCINPKDQNPLEKYTKDMNS